MSLPVWRSLLFVPATSERFVAKGPEVGADGLILDLEDSVAASAKDAARRAAPEIVRRFAARGIDTLVRINRPWRLAVRDLEAAVIPEITALLCPMVDSAEHVVALSETVAELEAERGIPAGRVRLCLAVETAKGYLDLREIARADPRSVTLSLGSEDFGLSMGMVADEETLYGPKQQVVACAREAGLLPMGFVGSIADFRDVDAFRRIVRRSKKMGLRAPPASIRTRCGSATRSSGRARRRPRRRGASLPRTTRRSPAGRVRLPWTAGWSTFRSRSARGRCFG